MKNDFRLKFRSAGGLSFLDWVKMCEKVNPGIALNRYLSEVIENSIINK